MLSLLPAEEVGNNSLRQLHFMIHSWGTYKGVTASVWQLPHCFAQSCELINCTKQNH